eukprot:Cvel_30192.t1-p1 / transcript=Cvel_30192.t1 / gene=Cvel_30192 / organism=Chromera_velia_CCMP2878 / gene_product=hypothetical protein / transcript_product=hypothetical protein / location=Cvel_scaffold4270:1-237(-) / protein_length=79 / sequence_SO=supercontig / SO=protein_coding / is_pseudo=false
MERKESTKNGRHCSKGFGGGVFEYSTFCDLSPLLRSFKAFVGRWPSLDSPQALRVLQAEAQREAEERGDYSPTGGAAGG